MAATGACLDISLEGIAQSFQLLQGRRSFQPGFPRKDGFGCHRLEQLDRLAVVPESPPKASWTPEHSSGMTVRPFAVHSHQSRALDLFRLS